VPLTVSVILAVRNGERYLVDAIDSVLAEAVDELVVVDDGSTDRTGSILASYGGRIVTIQQDPAGQAAALNRGIAAATGDLLAFQDADDLWVPHRQQRLIEALDPEVDAVCGAVQQFASPDLDAADAARLRIDEMPQQSQLLPCMLIRRASFELVGCFDAELQSAHNIDWMSRARNTPLRFAAVADVVVRRRIHSTNHGRVRAADNRLDLTRVMRAHLERMRSR
jgi:glycosyltransferase involved in cell wall biosynthesis